jgi:predicted RNA-binding protein with PIN domain
MAEDDTRGFADAAVVVVDAMNVLGSRPDGWWRDRDAALVRLVGDLAPFAGDLAAAVVVVADGRPVDDLPAGHHGSIEVVYARRGGHDAADDRIVELLDERGTDATVVVTADRDLRNRVEERGARVVGPRTLLARLS